MKTKPSDSDSDFLSIDPMRLDKEWLGQAGLFYEHATRLADARETYDAFVSEFAVVKAELDMEIRTNPSAYELKDKVTESAISATILLQKEYKLANDEVRKAKHRVDILQAAVTALDHRKRALIHLVELHGQNYFADPKVSADRPARESVEESTKQRVRSLGRRKERDREGDDE